jgi:hypothetical protein
MANHISNEFRKYFTRLTATAPICVSYGKRLTSGTDLFVIMEPSTATKCITVIPYGGAPPTPEGDRHESAIQIRLKIKDRQKGIRTMQQIINTLHGNTDVCASAKSRVYAVQSTPIVMDMYEGGEYIAYISNFIVKHTKL